MGVPNDRDIRIAHDSLSKIKAVIVPKVYIKVFHNLSSGNFTLRQRRTDVDAMSL